MILWLLMMEHGSKNKLCNSNGWRMINVSCWSICDSCEFSDYRAFVEISVYDFLKSKTATCHLVEKLSP